MTERHIAIHCITGTAEICDQYPDIDDGMVVETIDPEDIGALEQIASDPLLRDFFLKTLGLVASDVHSEGWSDGTNDL